MKILKDYIKGYDYVPILEIATHVAKDGTRYSLVKQDGYNSFYFLKGEEVIKREWYPGDKFAKLAIARLNDRRNNDIVNEITEQASYKAFCKFVLEQTGENFRI